MRDFLHSETANFRHSGTLTATEERCLGRYEKEGARIPIRVAAAALRAVNNLLPGRPAKLGSDISAVT
jgi:hypothetical protein